MRGSQSARSATAGAGGYGAGVRLVWYSLLRLVVLAGAVGIGYVLGLRGWLLILMGVVFAAAASYLLLRGPRDAAARQLAGALRARDVDADAEDAIDEAARRAASEREREAEG